MQFPDELKDRGAQQKDGRDGVPAAQLASSLPAGVKKGSGLRYCIMRSLRSLRGI